MWAMHNYWLVIIYIIMYLQTTVSAVNSGAALRTSSECSKDTTAIMVSNVDFHNFDEMHDIHVLSKHH